MAQIITQEEIDTLLKGIEQGQTGSPATRGQLDDEVQKAADEYLQRYRDNVRELQNAGKSQEALDYSEQFIKDTTYRWASQSQKADKLREQAQSYQGSVSTLEKELRESRDKFGKLDLIYQRIVSELDTSKSSHRELEENYSTLEHQKDILAIRVNKANEELGEMGTNLEYAPLHLARARRSARNRLNAVIAAGAIGILGAVGAYQIGYRSSPSAKEVSQIVDSYEALSAEKNKLNARLQKFQGDYNLAQKEIEEDKKEISMQKEIIQGYEATVLPFLQQQLGQQPR